ncbi:DUF3108 domain-containing protein [Geomonas sp. RF6]|uniref:DUF3108 domain-containing protein n=1 Tax=Geomonas sp. RF6 TaxID=2897342 RepID=UPI001E2A2F4E|nr:DUF3108 domain-containing protein [Geomonas sp. RF6]UFS71394.1 DUF3108 domain-containing protein [Geomonas sp. RF6]
MDLSAPVGVARQLSVELGEEGTSSFSDGGSQRDVDPDDVHPAQEGAPEPEGEGGGGGAPAPPTDKGEEPRVAEEAELPPAPDDGGEGGAADPSAQGESTQVVMSHQAQGSAAGTQRKTLNLPPPLRRGKEFVPAAMEKLTYRITLHGILIGEAVLLATNEKGAVRISVKVTSSPLITPFYPVDDLIETQLVMGNYLVTSIRQREGSYQRNTGFTLMLREKKAFSTATLREGVFTPLPRSDVTDLVSGFYYMRNQPLEVGKSLLLHIFDSGKYSLATVEVLRQERVSVQGLGDVETLVVVPRLQTEGIFRRTGEMLIWLTADGRKVPVKVETTIPIGKVRAELVSSEVQREGDETLKK